MVEKGKTRSQKASGRSARTRPKDDCPAWEEIKDLETRRKELKRQLRKVTDPRERRRLELEVKVLGWHLQRLRVRPRTKHK